MTRKDYVLIADALASTRPDHDKRQGRNLLDDEAMAVWRQTRDKIMHALQADNPVFDADRFNLATLK